MECAFYFDAKKKKKNFNFNFEIAKWTLVYLNAILIAWRLLGNDVHVIVVGCHSIRVQAGGVIGAGQIGQRRFHRAERSIGRLDVGQHRHLLDGRLFRAGLSAQTDVRVGTIRIIRFLSFLLFRLFAGHNDRRMRYQL